MSEVVARYEVGRDDADLSLVAPTASDAFTGAPVPSMTPPRLTAVTFLGRGRVLGEGLAAEKSADYAADVPNDDAAGMSATYAALERAVAEVVETDLDAMDEPALRHHLDQLARPIAQLQAARSRCMAAVEARRVLAAPPQRRSTARREARGEMARQQQLTPSDAKRASEAGQAATAHPATGQAFRDGDISDAHVRLIAGVLQQLPPDRVPVVEPQLLELATNRDAVAFGREARRVLAAEDIERAAHMEKRRRGQRRFRMTDTDEGGLIHSGEAHGLAAETARAALRAFRRPDTPGEHRRPEQRDADAFEEVCAAALRSLDAPSEHGTRPQVIVIMQADQIGRPIGTARFALSGQPVTTAELAPILTDCAIGRLVVDAKGTPLEASEMVRDVPAGLWRALVARDGGCTWNGCDALASWCDVAHGEHPFRRKGRLSPANAMLLCRRHHRQFDHGNYRVEIDGDQVTYRRVSPTDPQESSLVVGESPPETNATPPDPLGAAASSVDPKGSGTDTSASASDPPDPGPPDRGLPDPSPPDPDRPDSHPEDPVSPRSGPHGSVPADPGELGVGRPDDDDDPQHPRLPFSP